ncbi:MAG: hypothetical protein DELT_01640 [Desulfovibrio sp.]
MAEEWTPELDTQILDERMDNAMRRASGSVGMDIAFDKGRMRALKDTAANALDAGAGSAGPLFMRVGKGLFEAGTCKIGDSLNPKDIGGEILAEFYAEANAAFQAGKAALGKEAQAYLEARAVPEERRATLLAAADAAFAAPDKEMFTKVGLPFVRSVAAPSTQAVLGGLAGFLCFFLLLRSPHLAFFSGVLVGGGSYYLSRSRIRKRCEDLLNFLPRNIYEMLATEWNAGIRRFAETINMGLKD